MFNQPALLITDITIVQDVLINNTYDYVKPMNIISDAVAFIGRGLALSEGEDHKRQRKMMNPAFTHSNIKKMLPTITQMSSKLISVIEDKINLGESNIILTPYISQATLDIIGLVGFNYEFNSLKSPNELADAYKTLISPPTILHIIYSRLSYYFPFIRSIPIEINKSFINACAVIERESKNLVKRKYKEAEIGELKDDLLSVLIKLNKTLPIEEKLTDEELKYQIMTFLLAGHETTNISTNWALYLLSQHPRHMCKTYYVKIKETLRLHSPAVMIRRTNIKDKVFGNYLIPKNTIIMISISGLHKSPEIWGPTATEFDPKRWLDSTLTENVSNLNFLPFSAGARSCIGNKLALVEFKVILSILIRNFVFQITEGSHIKKRNFVSSKPYSHFEFTISRVES
ncbi:cytochrome P450 [Rhizophagus irregularis]|uniref:Cytochrome P450 n=2 Tax=Rhizophagus irregularis TaxID=588596 RepID=A0A2N0SI20_9GLOM|nr:cytochrome P450 [Rhizophagus irregularis]CAB4478310.1 unnamed protein product [Rhizophagus irregularis]